MLGLGAGVAARPVPAVGTTDLWKLAGLVLVVVDHTGLFFLADEAWWRVVGRLAAPIFFFLVGYARSGAVPWTWLALGAALTATDHLTSDDPSETALNILLNFTLLRTALPHIEAWITGAAGRAGEARSEAWRTAALVAALIALVPALDPHLEYGAEGWLWALFGLWQRLAGENAAPGSVVPGSASSWRGWVRAGVGLAAALVYTWREILDYEFEGAQAWVLALLVAGLAAALARFRRAALRRQPSPALARPLAVAGRHSLEIYAVSLFAMQVTAHLLGVGTETEG